MAIYSVIGEELKPHLAQLTGSKVWEYNAFGIMTTANAFMIALGQIPCTVLNPNVLD